MPGSSLQEDIISWGVLRLLDAIETFNPDRPGKKAKVKSYAICKNRWPSWMDSGAKTGCPGVYVCAYRKWSRRISGFPRCAVVSKRRTRLLKRRG